MIPGSAQFAGMNEAQRNAIVQALLAQQQGAPAPAPAAPFANPYQDIVDPSDPAAYDSTLGEVVAGFPASSPFSDKNVGDMALEVAPPNIDTIDSNIVNPDVPSPAPPSTIDDQGNPAPPDFGIDVSDPATSPPSGNILGDFGTNPGFSLGDMVSPGLMDANQGFTTDPGNFGPDPGGFTTDPGGFNSDPGGFDAGPSGAPAGFDAGVAAGFSAGFDAGVGGISAGPGGTGEGGAGGGDGGAGK